MNVRRSAAALAAVAVLGTATPAVASPSPSPSVQLPDGLYGTGDPTYDGVWRQSLAILAQLDQGVTPAKKAVDWLAGQQCANGAFAAFRAEPGKPCDARTMVDTNSTAAAVQALAGVPGRKDAKAATAKAVTWLKSVQNTDGGWGYTPGGPSDANSTSVVIGALDVADESGSSKVRKNGKSPYDALLKLALPCTGKDAGAFAYQPDKKGGLAANADATAAAVTALIGNPLGGGQEPGDAQSEPACTKPGSPDDAVVDTAFNGASWLVRSLAEDKHLKSAMPGAEAQPDYGNTADAVVALAAAGFGKEATASARWLEANALKWAEQSGPAAYAQLVLAARAAGLDPRDFGGADLVALLNATGPAPAAQDSPSKSPDTSPTKKEDQKDDDGEGVSVWWIIGVGLVGGIGIGFLISARKKPQP
ncbi:prenyltransferase/squalene oxidase repeat-containing protein [Streptomyces sp. enrichment culture]|uniref:prenyltransferase/squalene oxidase repeat-containing protein n=1 Tax=Streptomyces sp. enrichment culture TaxID=1795815 RepID=UPI003F56D4A0